MVLFDERSLRLVQRAGDKFAFYNRKSRRAFGEFTYEAEKEFDIRLRHAWHWHIVYADPYCVLDGWEDDAFSWVNATSDGDLVPYVELQRIREGLEDYHCLLTLEKLGSGCKVPLAPQARKHIKQRLASFSLDQSHMDHDRFLGDADRQKSRKKAGGMVEAFSELGAACTLRTISRSVSSSSVSAPTPTRRMPSRKCH